MLAAMSYRAPLTLLLLPLALTACGGPAKPAAGARDVAAEPSTDREAAPNDDELGREGGPTAASRGMPTECAAQDGDLCLPPKDFVNKLCAGDYPSVAAAMFQAGTPWTRGYLVHEVEAWNASGGGSSAEKLATDEEVLILRHRSASTPGGMTVSGAEGGYDALRWDSMCVTLEQGHLRFDPPPKPKNARVIWARLEVEMRDALKKDPEVYETYIEHRKECQGVTMGTVSKACEKIDAAFSVLLASHIREKGGLPAPAKLPR
jgi:hypothetical protein